MIFKAIVNNLALLLALSIMYSFLNRKWKADSFIGKLAGGALFGIVAIIGMMNPFIFEKGVIFDGRSILICIAGVFGGPVTAFIAALFSGIYRIYLGGAGLKMGILVILTSALLGSGYYYLKNYGIRIKHPFNILLLGLVVHLSMIFLMFTLPSSLSNKVIAELTLPVLIAYPLTTVALSYILEDQEKKNLAISLLRQSEERFRNAIINSPVPIMIHADDGEILQINNAWTRVTGYKMEDLPTIFDWIKKAYGERSDEMQEIIKNVFKNKAISSKGEYLINTKSEKKAILEFNSAPLEELPDGRRIIISTAIDITSRKIAEEATRQSEEKYRKIVETSTEGIWVIDKNSKTSFVNKKLTEMLGYSEKEMINRSLFDFMDEVSKKEAMNKVKKRQLGISELHDFKFTKKDGEFLWTLVSTSPLFSNDGQYKGALAMVTDNSERKKAIEALRLSEEYYRSLIENAVDYILILNKEGSIIFASPAFYRQLGYSNYEITGKPIFDLIYPDDLTDFRTQYSDQSNRPGFVNLVEFRLRNKKKEWRTIESFMTNLLDVPVIKGIIMNARDITEKKMVEYELKNYHEHLEKLVAERTQDLESFTYSVSHDLKAPLRAIGSFAHILSEDYGKELNKDASHLLSVIIDSTNKMHQLIDDLLNFSKISKKEISAITIDTNLLIKEIMGELKEETKNRNIRWEINELPHIHGDRSMLKQVFVNLLSNAIKFSRNKEKAVIDVGCDKVENRDVFFVKDNGIGFNMKYTGKLFQVFQRLHSPEEFDGSGVGLAIVKRIIKKHGGNIWAEGEINKGSVFRFFIQHESS
jgi:PAS domain S-box-containing protein